MTSKVNNIDEEISSLRKKLSSFLYADRLTSSDHEAKKRIENQLYDLLSRKQTATHQSFDDAEKKKKQLEFSQQLKAEKAKTFYDIVEHFKNKNRG